MSLKDKLKYFWKDITGKNNKSEIMTVHYDTTLNKIECYNWISEKIHPFCGVFTPEMFEEIKLHCNIGKFRISRIYIWAGSEIKHLAYCEPIEDYLKDINLWKTGRGYTREKWIADIQKETSNYKCPTCGK